VCCRTVTLDVGLSSILSTLESLTRTSLRSTLHSTQQHTATHCNTQQHTEPLLFGLSWIRDTSGGLQRVAVCRSVLQRGAVCCSVVQCVAVCCSESTFVRRALSDLENDSNVLQRGAVCCSVVQCVAVRVPLYVGLSWIWRTHLSRSPGPKIGVVKREDLF